MKIRITAFALLLIGAAIGFFVYNSEASRDSKFNFKLGLDLSGGSHLIYKADVSEIRSDDVNESMEALRNVIEARVNLFGVSEPLVQVEEGFFGGENQHKLIVELPGVTDIEKAIMLIGATPLLEFKRLDKDVDFENIAEATSTDIFLSTGLTGRLLERAQLEFNPQTGEPSVVLIFNDEGADLFARITGENIGNILAIFLDGNIISSPIVRDEITGGRAEISGGFTAEEAKLLVRDLNYGALPVPIELLSTQTIGATLGEKAIEAGVLAGIISFVLISLFLIIWYRLPGAISVVALAVYVAIVLAIFKLIPVTLTAAGIAGFILSVGMAVDANILIFERMKEELRAGKNLHQSVKDGFIRAWSSIRDSNISSIITAVILFYFASTPIVKGFALVFLIGVLVSMFSAITFSRTLLLAILPKDENAQGGFLFRSGFNRTRS